jgi:hypothetical protein
VLAMAAPGGRMDAARAEVARCRAISTRRSRVSNSVGLTGATAPPPEDDSRRRTIMLSDGPDMQQDGTITFAPVVQTATLRTWHIIVAALLFACVIYGVVWWARRRSKNDPGSLNLCGDDPDSGKRS